MAKQRLTPSELDARLRFIISIMLGSMVFLTVAVNLYALVFVTQPIGGQSENDKMFFNLLNSIATFATGTLAGLLIGRDGAKDVMAAQIANKEVDAKNIQADKRLESELEINELKAEVEADAVRARLDAKPNDQMPAEQPIDTDWDKE